MKVQNHQKEKGNLKTKIRFKRILYYFIMVIFTSLYAVWAFNGEIIKLNETTGKYYLNEVKYYSNTDN
jgi:hypothetical protein